MAEGARLESVYTATYRGFESLSHRHKSSCWNSTCSAAIMLLPPLKIARSFTRKRFIIPAFTSEFDPQYLVSLHLINACYFNIMP